MNTESANRFIAALIKSLQTLCHGYVDFDDGIEIIGHLYLNIDSGSTFDYVLKEKVCKNAENQTVFVSKSFHAEGKPENTLIHSDKDMLPSQQQMGNIGDSAMSPSGTTRIQSAITNISNVISGNSEHHSSQSPLPLNTGRRKRDHNGSYSNQNLPYKYTTLQSSSASAMPYFNNSAKQHSSSRDSSKHYSASQSQGEFFAGDSNQSSALGGDDEEDLHLDVTFVKEEYQDRQRAARAHQDQSSSQNSMMSENNSGAFPMGYHPGAQNQQFAGSGGSGNGGDMNSTINQSFQDPSQVDTGQHHIPAPNPRSNINSSNVLPPPNSNNCPENNPQTFQVPAAPSKYFRCNVCGIIIRHKNNIKRHMRRHNAHLTPQQGFGNRPSFSLEPEEANRRGHNVIHTIRQNKWAVARARDDATAGPPSRMPDGVKPLCGYVHPDDAKKWMMYELIPGSGVFIHQENYNVVLSKTRQDRPDGKAMARYLMSCFWRQSELVGASIAEPPKPHQKSLDRGIVHAILGFCQHHSRELPTDIRRTIQQKIGYAKFYFVKKTHDPDLPRTPAAIAAEASPRRMSIEMSRRNSAGIPVELPPLPHQTSHGKRGRRGSEVILSHSHRASDNIHSDLPRSDDSPEMPRPSSASSMDIVSPRISAENIHGRLESSSSSAANEMPSLSRMAMNEALASSRAPHPLSSDIPHSASNRSSELISSGSAPSSDHLNMSSRMLFEMTNRLSQSHPSDLPGRLMDLPSRMITSEMMARAASDDADAGSSGGSRAHLDVSGSGGTSSTSELINRMSSSGAVPAGVSRGFLDMLNNFYPNN